MIFWITGRKNSGKTTLAHKLAKQLDAVVIDGDEVRLEKKNFDFSYAGIEENLVEILCQAQAVNHACENVVIACVSPYAGMRKKFQAMLPGCIEIEMPFGELWPGTTYEPTEYGE